MNLKQEKEEDRISFCRRGEERRGKVRFEIVSLSRGARTREVADSVSSYDVLVICPANRNISMGRQMMCFYIWK
jgi:hypothetical protein